MGGAAARYPAAWLVIRCALGAAFFAAWYGIYAGLNTLGSGRCTVWDSPGLYVPIAVYPYVFGAAAVALAPFVWHRSPRAFARLLLAYAGTSAVFFLLYWLYPVCMQRGAYDAPGLADALMRMVVGLDDPANCFPSSHCMFATMGVLASWRGGAGTAAASAITVTGVVVAASTILVGQHYVADVVVGVPLAAVLFTGWDRLGHALLFRGTTGAARPDA